jgi:hypothetical protein
MVKREDKLKSLLGGKASSKMTAGPQEVSLDGGISPVASIKVIGVGGG